LAAPPVKNFTFLLPLSRRPPKFAFPFLVKPLPRLMDANFVALRPLTAALWFYSWSELSRIYFRHCLLLPVNTASECSPLTREYTVSLSATLSRTDHLPNILLKSNEF
jgi:hypothetical protein